jgi:hypothetical protein
LGIKGAELGEQHPEIEDIFSKLETLVR